MSKSARLTSVMPAGEVEEDGADVVGPAAGEAGAVPELVVGLGADDLAEGSAPSDQPDGAWRV